MAMIDYGTILIKDGVIVNRNQMFMDASDTGYIAPCVDGDYFAYAGDENFMLCFYKNQVAVVVRDEIVSKLWLGMAGLDIKGETLRDENFLNMAGSGCNIHIRALDQRIYLEETCLDYDDYLDSDGEWKEKKMPWLLLREAMGLTEAHQSERAQEEYRKFAKRARRKRLFANGMPKEYYGIKNSYLSWPDRYIPEKYSVKWSYKGHEYEAITGYGIDNNEEILEDIRGHYCYTVPEIEYIKSTFDKDRAIRGI